MKVSRNIWVQGVCATGLSIVLLSGRAQMAQGASSYRAAPQGIEVPAEMRRYNSDVLRITFGNQAEASSADAWSAAIQDRERRAEACFDPARLPVDDASDPEEPVSAPVPGETPADPQYVNVPEPGTFALLALGLSAFVMRFRKKRRVS